MTQAPVPPFSLYRLLVAGTLAVTLSGVGDDARSDPAVLRVAQSLPAERPPPASPPPASPPPAPASPLAVPPRDTPGTETGSASGMPDPAVPNAAALDPATPDPAAPDKNTSSSPAPRRENPKPQEPTLLSADQVMHEDTTHVITATGNVHLSQEGRVLMADKVSYNQDTKVVVAAGNVRIIEKSGEVVFSDYVELTDDLRHGFINNVRMLMADNSRIAGNEAERVDGQMMRMSHMVYSPCDLCATDPDRPPLWQIKAVRAVHDANAKEVRYGDVTLEVAGIPVAYTPYFSHPDPTVKRRSGFLAPVFGYRKDLGSFIRNSYYFDIAPEMDATLFFSPFTTGNFQAGGEWRQRFEDGQLQLNATGTIADFEKGSGAANLKPDTFRGYILGRGLFNFDENWRWGFDATRATDKTYLRQFHHFRENVLTSRVFTEGFFGRDYVSLSALGFQDLRATLEEEQPKILPMLQYSALGEPGGMLGGRWSLEAGVMSVLRDSGTNSRRLSFEPGWQRDFISDSGLVTTVSASVRGDAYYTNRYDKPDVAGNREISANTLRILPQSQITVRYPLVRSTGTVHQLVEPIAALTMAPNIAKDNDIPDEDSRDLEFDDTNLFLPNRFPGYDRLEGGTRVTYGIRTSLFGYGGGAASLFLGQSYRLTRDGTFPAVSGLEDRFSDVVGRLDLQPLDWADLSYSFRYDKDTLHPRKHEVSTEIGPPVFRLRSTYVYLDQRTDTHPTASNGLEREYGTLGGSLSLSQFWSLSAAHSQNFAPDPGPRASAVALSYEDECLTFQTIGQRDFTVRPGVGTGTTVYFRLIFKNLGEVESPKLSSSLFQEMGKSSSN